MNGLCGSSSRFVSLINEHLLSEALIFPPVGGKKGNARAYFVTPCNIRKSEDIFHNLQSVTKSTRVSAKQITWTVAHENYWLRAHDKSTRDRKYVGWLVFQKWNYEKMDESPAQPSIINNNESVPLLEPLWIISVYFQVKQGRAPFIPRAATLAKVNFATLSVGKVEIKRDVELADIIIRGNRIFLSASKRC